MRAVGSFAADELAPLVARLLVHMSVLAQRGSTESQTRSLALTSIRCLWVRTTFQE